jgi:hypothetical protein
MSKELQQKIKEILSARFKNWAYKITKEGVRVMPANIKYTQILLTQAGLTNVKIIADKAIAKPCKTKV